MAERWLRALKRQKSEEGGPKSQAGAEIAHRREGKRGYIRPGPKEACSARVTWFPGGERREHLWRLLLLCIQGGSSGILPPPQQLLDLDASSSSSSSWTSTITSSGRHAALQQHTKRRNRLTTDRLNQLVYIQFNSRLLSKKKKIKQRKNIDVLLSTDASEAQGFLFEGGDDHAFMVFPDGDEGAEGIPWECDWRCYGNQ